MAKLEFQTPRGIKDILPEEQPYWLYVRNTIQQVVELYGWNRLDLPVFEETALFQRGVGEGTDIVEKEMYTFLDRSKTSLTLRPEFTAGTMRAFLQHGMASLPKPVKVWSTGPVFRYEKPQAGRFRQHVQFNVEAIGEQDPALDLEVMSVAWHLFETLGFKDLSFQLNSIGCPECRPKYLIALKAYYKDHLSIICEDCRLRMEKNPMRLLDCKNEQCQPLIDTAPSISDFLGEECRAHFNELLTYLNDLKRPYTLNHRLVRGLDYYTKTVFEVWAQGIGAQNAVCGGGRYDRLSEVLGGPPTPAVGFATGLERIILTLKEQGVEVPGESDPTVYIVNQGTEAKRLTVGLLTRLRKWGIRAVMGFGGRSFKAQFREANRFQAPLTFIVGEEEAGSSTLQVKDMASGEQVPVAMDQLETFLRNKGLIS
jgi:histidyl-tRNA synthetase